jgi:hypothetical protein
MNSLVTKAQTEGRSLTLDLEEPSAKLQRLVDDNQDINDRMNNEVLKVSEYNRLKSIYWENRREIELLEKQLGEF